MAEAAHAVTGRRCSNKATWLGRMSLPTTSDWTRGYDQLVMSTANKILNIASIFRFINNGQFASPIYSRHGASRGMNAARCIWRVNPSEHANRWLQMPWRSVDSSTKLLTLRQCQHHEPLSSAWFVNPQQLIRSDRDCRSSVFCSLYLPQVFTQQ